MLDPDARKVLDLITKRNTKPFEAMTPLAARVYYRNTALLGQTLPPVAATVQALAIPGPRGHIAVRWYRPKGCTIGEILPALVFFHGGGFVLGDLDTHDSLCHQLCNQAGIAVFSVDYRMGPEHKFPAAQEDAYAAVSWIAQHAEELSVDPAKIAVGGDSAGGTLAATCALMARDYNGPPLAFQMLIYPGLDFRCLLPSHSQFQDGHMLTRNLIDYFCSHYLGQDQDKLDWRMSPLLAQDLGCLPRTLVLTAGQDPLVDEGKAYAGRLIAAGNQAEYVCFAGQIHGFMTMDKMISQAGEAVALCARYLAEI